jgi:hypothetical protein
MAKKRTAEDNKFQDQANELREDLSNAYAFIEGQRFTQAISVFTPEDAMDQFIERISGKDTIARPNAINRIKNIEARVLAAVTRIKSMPDGAFRRKDSSTDVNT